MFSVDSAGFGSVEWGAQPIGKRSSERMKARGRADESFFILTWDLLVWDWMEAGDGNGSNATIWSALFVERERTSTVGRM